MGIDRGDKEVFPSPVVRPVHAFVCGSGSRFTQPGKDVTGHFFLPVAPHEPGYFAFLIDGLFVPLLFCQVRVVADRFTCRT